MTPSREEGRSMASEPHREFAFALHRLLIDGGEGGGEVPVWSPYSVAAALGLAAAGARGTTYGEMAAALAPHGDLNDLSGRLASAANVPDATLAVSNGLWIRDDLPFHESYQRSVLALPGGAVHAADFGGDPEGSRQVINTDVEKTTHGLIRELLTPGLIHSDVAAVIVNALYLKVGWLLPFPGHATSPRPFHAPSGTREVATMEQRERMPYAAAAGWRMVSLSGEGGVVADILLPDGDLAAAESQLDTEVLSRLYGAQRETEVGLRLPRFRVDGAQTILNRPLERLGVRAAFDPDGADFSGITPAHIWIETVVHKAVLRVDEQGFEGAAATAAVMRLVSAWAGESVDFHVDRPFLVVVRHVSSGTIYFLARVTEPSIDGPSVVT